MGRQINGLSQANSYGDDAQMATNYPIVRLVGSSGQTYYCRTFNFSTMGVNTGTVVQGASFTVPRGIAKGAAELYVVANGIASKPLSVSVSGFKLPKELKEVKELKVELKEIELTAVNENRLKDSETGNMLQQGTDPALLSVIRQMASRLDQLEKGVAQQRSMITPEQRPEVGETALAAG
jgi:hypothetical protein